MELRIYRVQRRQAESLGEENESQGRPPVGPYPKGVKLLLMMPNYNILTQKTRFSLQHQECAKENYEAKYVHYRQPPAFHK